jgi:hypothetical protein
MPFQMNEPTEISTLPSQYPWRRISVALIATTGLVAFLPYTMVYRYSQNAWIDSAMIGYFVGCFYAQSTMLAAWLAFGPVAKMVRVQSGLAWLVFLIGLSLAFIRWQDGRLRLEDIAILAALVLGQVFVAFLFGYGFRVLAKVSVGPLASHQQQDVEARHFGIRQLMICTALAAGFFALVRGILGMPGLRGTSIADIGAVLLLGFSGIACCYGMVVAALLRRGAAIAVALTFLVVVGYSYAESKAFSALVENGGQPSLLELFAINAMTSFFCFLFAGNMRLAGYRIVR